MSAVEPDPSADATPAAPIRVAGQAYETLPQDLYIPPDALRVFLEAFEGPLDLLLYLIRRQNLDILDIPVHAIAEQYIAYIDLMQRMTVELAGEYLLMAAMLAEIKSRMLLPRPPAEEQADEDPRAELVRRLQEYEQFKQAAEGLDDHPRVGRDIVAVQHGPARLTIVQPRPQLDLQPLLGALQEVLNRAEMRAEHRIEREPLSVREHMSRILETLAGGRPVTFAALVEPGEGRLGIVVSFLAILELARETLLVIDQREPYTRLTLRLAGQASIETTS